MATLAEIEQREQELKQALSRLERHGGRWSEVATDKAAARAAFRRLEQEKARQEQVDHQASMYRDYAEPFGIPVAVANKIYALAWEHGHASGFGEVEMHYQDFADLAQVAYEAGISDAG